MSQSAYELLLQANSLYQEGKKEEAAKCYREVLRQNPSAPQRQVAETQLRDMGELPYTFATSGKVIRRRSDSKNNKRHEPKHKNKRQKNNQRSNQKNNGTKAPSPPPPRQPPSPNTPSHTPPRPQRRSILQQNAQGPSLPQTSNAPSLRSHPSSSSSRPSSSWNPNAWKGKPDANNMPQMHSEKLLSMLNNLFKLPQEDEENGEKTPPKPPPPRKTEPPQPTDSAPKPPKQKPDESDEDFQQRLQRYNTWKEYNEKYPDVDINVAQRLAEEGISLKQFRAQQGQKRRAYLNRRRSHLKKLYEYNANLRSHELLQTWLEEKEELCLLRAEGPELHGILLDNRLYQWLFRPQEGKRKKLPKLTISLVFPLEYREQFLSLAHVEEERAKQNDFPPKEPDKRFQLKDAELQKSQDAEKPYYFRFYNGLWMRGYVLWFDDFHIGLQLTDQSEDGEEISFRALMFRHAVDKVNKRRPTLWPIWPSYNSDS